MRRKIMDLKINSTVRSNAHVELAIMSNHEQDPDGMTITIQPDETNVTAAGGASSRIRVKVSDEVILTSYSLQTNSTFSFSITMNTSSVVESISTKTNKNQNSWGINVTSIDAETPDISPMSLSLRPTPPSIAVKQYTFEEKFKDFWSIMVSL